jgi:hypothetical protein
MLLKKSGEQCLQSARRVRKRSMHWRSGTVRRWSAVPVGAHPAPRPSTCRMRNPGNIDSCASLYGLGTRMVFRRIVLGVVGCYPGVRRDEGVDHAIAERTVGLPLFD